MGDEYIKRRDVLIKLEIAYDMARLDQKLPISDLQHEVNLIKAADVQPVHCGQWEYYKNNGIIDTYICTNCENKVEMAIDVEPSSYCYCPKCGALMKQ